MLASKRILNAALYTTHRGLVFIRYQTLSPTVAVECITSLAEALLDIPMMVQGMQYFTGGEEELLLAIRRHLARFDHSKWPGSINLLHVFETELELRQIE
jgi:hypothetical protein